MKMRKFLILSIFFSTTTFAAYKTYNPHQDSKFLDRAITGVCKQEHQKYDDLDFSLKENISSMSEADSNKAIAALKNAERARWECIERELNKKDITLNLERLYKENGL